MSETSSTGASAPVTHAPGTPNWVDVSSTDVAKASAFYSGLFGWQAVDQGPESGGYVMLLKEGAPVAAVGGTQMEGQPSAWNVYFASDDADETARKVEAAGGKVIAPPFDVLGQGKMAVFQDPTGAFFSVWQPLQMAGFARSGEPNTFGWCELNTRAIDRAAEFYAKVFGWNAHESSASTPETPYTEWQVAGQSFGGAMDQAVTNQPPELPPYWLTYFISADIEGHVAKARELGGNVMLDVTAYPGGRFAVIADPTGASFGLMASA